MRSRGSHHDPRDLREKPVLTVNQRGPRLAEQLLATACQWPHEVTTMKKLGLGFGMTVAVSLATMACSGAASDDPTVDPAGPEATTPGQGDAKDPPAAPKPAAGD